MSLLYVNDSGATIGIEGNCCTVKQKDGSKRMLPIESLDGITIMGQSRYCPIVRVFCNSFVFPLTVISILSPFREKKVRPLQHKKESTKEYTRGGAPLHELCSLSSFPIFICYNVNFPVSPRFSLTYYRLITGQLNFFKCMR